MEEELDVSATTKGFFQSLSPDLQRQFVPFFVNRGNQIQRIPFNEVLYFIKTCIDKGNSNFGRLLETVSRREKHFLNKIKAGRFNVMHTHEIVSQAPEKLGKIRSREKIRS